MDVFANKFFINAGSADQINLKNWSREKSI